jgi:hypothetical protein
VLAFAMMILGLNESLPWQYKSDKKKGKGKSDDC